LKWRLASQACCMWGYSWLLFYYVTGQWVMTALNCSCVSFVFCWNWQNACGFFSAISMYSICNCPWTDGTCLLLNYTGWCVFACRYIQSTCATSGEGLYEGLDWLSSNIAKKVRQQTCLLRLLSFMVGF
jgi:hypothetical protein